MNGDLLLERSISFNSELAKHKEHIGANFPWYPYGSMNNFAVLRDILKRWPIDVLIGDGDPVLDIGAADGDVAFFLESLGYEVDLIDNPATNFNNLNGARLLKETLNSSVGIYEIDLDTQFRLPDKQYNLIFFLGILYHLRNPFFVLESLSYRSKFLLVSTRIAQFSPDGSNIRKLPVAYLVAPDESNNDATNYWIFSEIGLKRLLERTGWEILEMVMVGDTVASNPRDSDHDERAFALLKSTR